MSNQEAIALLRNLEDSLDSYCELSEEGKTAFRMAIEALSSSEIPNSSDTISRQTVKEKSMTKEGIIHRLQYARHRIDNVTYAPDVLKAIDIAIEAVGNTDSDTISRQAVLDALNNIEVPRNASWYQYYQQALTAVDKLPPAQPERIIHCKDCEWWTKQEHSPQGRCALSGMYPTGGWFCGNARMREVTT